MSFFEKLVLFFKLRIKYVPYFNNKDKDFKNLKILDSNIDDKIIDIYNKLTKNKDKYDKFISLFNAYKSDIETHNNEVEMINNINDQFDYNQILESPLNLDLDCYLEYLQIISKYKISKETKEIKEQILDMVSNYDDICYQYNLKDYIVNPIKSIDRYITKKELFEYNNEYLQVWEKIKNQSKNYYHYDFIGNLNYLVERNNQLFVNAHKNDAIFDNINGLSLDDDQRIAILKNDNACLTIAGAGSGKTLTICGKVKYLLEKENIDPKDILLLSYSRKSAEDLSVKIHGINEELRVGTFHKLGLDILKETNNRNYDVEEQFDEIIDRYFREEIYNKPDIATKLLRYYSLYMNYEEDSEYKNKDEQYKDLKEKDYRTLKDTLENLSPNVEKRQTLKKEYVKSYEELSIANFYFINGINYTYEKRYEYSTPGLDEKIYHPDFYLDDYNIYHEHYGIDKNGNANQYGPIEGKKYVQNMHFKRNVHLIHNTTCLETYSYQCKDDTIYTELERQLKEHGVKFNPLNSEQINNALSSIYLDHEFASLINVIKTFISLYKAKYKDNTYFDKLLEINKDNEEISNSIFYRCRVHLFLDICKDIYNYYYKILRENDRIDFDDMILMATDNVDKLDNYKYKYIIVDEFQDISYSRMMFLKSLIKHGDSSLFAVGDDWQAIYRFSGCDLNIFIDFQDFFGDCVINKINSTHRNSQELQDIVTPFIIKNKQQYQKIIKSNKHLVNPVNIVYFEQGNKEKEFINILNYISNENSEAKILVLGRTNNDINKVCSTRVKYNPRNRSIKSEDYPLLKMTYSTVHASKGLEEDYVILINADDGKMGFPNKIEDDPVLSLVLSDNNIYPFAEERRLFYVALTRTRTKVFLLVNHSHESKFVKEIKDKCNIINSDNFHEDYIIRKCPKCGGKLILRQDKNGRSFYGCENYPYCNYSCNDILAVEYNQRCPRCGDYIVSRRDRYGREFYGCNNYPVCKYTRNRDVH